MQAQCQFVLNPVWADNGNDERMDLKREGMDRSGVQNHHEGTMIVAPSTYPIADPDGKDCRNGGMRSADVLISGAALNNDKRMQAVLKSLG